MDFANPLLFCKEQIMYNKHIQFPKRRVRFKKRNDLQSPKIDIYD